MTEAARIPETYDREARLVAKRAAREAKRQANREVWARDPRNSNVRVVNRQGTGPPIGIQSGPPFAYWDKPGWDSISTAVLEAPALVAGFDDVAVMSQSQRLATFG
jgi:hypothetical protein